MQAAVCQCKRAFEPTKRKGDTVSNLLRLIGRRLIALPIMIFGVTILVFFIMALSPIDQAYSVLGENATEAQAEQYREEHGLNDRRIAAIRCLGFHGRSCSQSRDGRGRAGCFGWNRVVPVLLQEHLVAYRGGEVHGSQYQLFGLGRPVRARVAGNDADADIDRLLRGHLGGHCIGRKRLERAVRP